MLTVPLSAAHHGSEVDRGVGRDRHLAANRCVRRDAGRRVDGRPFPLCSRIMGLPSKMCGPHLRASGVTGGRRRWMAPWRRGQSRTSRLGRVDQCQSGPLIGVEQKCSLLARNDAIERSGNRGSRCTAHRHDAADTGQVVERLVPRHQPLSHYRSGQAKLSS